MTTVLTPLFGLVALAVILAAIVLEGWVLGRRGPYDWRATGVSFFNLFTRSVLSVLLPLGLAAPVIAWAEQHPLTRIEVNHGLALAGLFLGQEFCYYWFHRAAHRVRWFWCNHAVHHSPNQLNFSAAIRIGSLGRLSGTLLFYVPLIWLGYPAAVVVTMLQINLLYQFWIHGAWIPKLGWLEYVLNTPSAHRVHHAANLDYLDANYGGVLIVFDRLFGTYRAERDDEPCRYGLVHPLTTYNPIKVDFHEWMALARDLLRARSLRAVLGYLFMPPGWQPDGNGSTTEDLRRRAALPPQAAADTASPLTVPLQPPAAGQGT